ncbi:sodium:solute symporter family transporter [Streptomyces tendae]|uniref:sodium:solute symporter family transporter n=1 Tax=Streptomyces tendae TaxID=1932 RepID=UPI0033B985A6
MLTTAAPGNQTLVLTGFLLFIVIALFVSVFAGLDGEAPSEFYVGARDLTPWAGGLALAGSYLSTSVLVTITGLVAFEGFDGILLTVDVLLSLCLLLLLARPLRLSGAHTLGDVFALRASGAGPRVAAAVVTLAVTVPLLIVQLVAAGSVSAALLGFPRLGVQQICTVLIGALVVVCGMLSGAKGLTAVQILAALTVLGAFTAASVAVLHAFQGDLGALLSAADDGSDHPGRYLSTGGLLGTDGGARLDFIGTHLMLILGSACMPHVLIRVFAAREATAARRSVRHAVGVVGLVCLSVVVLGMGAAALVGARTISHGKPNADDALLLLAGDLAGGAGTLTGSVLFTAIACAVFLSVLAVVGGAAVAAAGSIARDVHRAVVRDGQDTASRETLVARAAVLVVGGGGIVVAALLQGHAAGFLSLLAAAIATTAIAPALVYSLCWKGYNRAGLHWTVYGGTITATALLILSPAFSGGPLALFPSLDLACFDHNYAVVVGLPTALLLGWAGSVTEQRHGSRSLHR